MKLESIQKQVKKIVTVSPEFYRPNDVQSLCGDATKAENILKWKPEISFSELIKDMMDAEINA